MFLIPLNPKNPFKTSVYLSLEVFPGEAFIVPLLSFIYKILMMLFSIKTLSFFQYDVWRIPTMENTEKLHYAFELLYLGIILLENL